MGAAGLLAVMSSYLPPVGGGDEAAVGTGRRRNWRGSIRRVVLWPLASSS